MCAFLAGAAVAQELPDGVAAYDMALSVPETAGKAVLDGELRRTYVGRRLLAETARVPCRSAHGGAPVAYRRKPRALVFDFRALAAAGRDDAVLDLARELCRASMGLPLELPQETPACRQTELRFALELSVRDSAFARGLRHAPPASERKRVAREIGLFADDPSSFYREAAQGEPPEVAARRASEEGENGPARVREAMEDFDGRGAEELRPLARRWEKR